jgi:hypothetical protein
MAKFVSKSKQRQIDAQEPAPVAVPKAKNVKKVLTPAQKEAAKIKKAKAKAKKAAAKAAKEGKK